MPFFFFASLFALPPVLREIVFALAPNSSSMTSSVLLIRFAIFRAVDVYSTDSVNIVLSQRPSPVRSKSRAHGDGYLNILLIQLRDTIVGIITVYLTMSCRRPYLQSEGLLFHYFPRARACVLWAHFVFRWNTANTMAMSATCRSVSDLSMARHWYNSFCLPLVCCASTCKPVSNTCRFAATIFSSLPSVHFLRFYTQ